MDLHKTHQWNIGYFLVAFIALLLFQSWWSTSQTTRAIGYSEFLELLERQAITELVIGENEIQGRYTSPDGRFERFVTQRENSQYS